MNMMVRQICTRIWQ